MKEIDYLYCMKGKLHRTVERWTVTYITSDELSNGRKRVKIAEIPLHESDISKVSQTYVNDEFETIHIWDDKNVEFEIIEEFAKLSR